jgi:mxaJ protein
MRVSVAVPPAELAAIPFSYAISMGVRKRDAALQERLNAAIARLQPQIDAILAEYNVPRVDAAPVRRAESVR